MEGSVFSSAEWQVCLNNLVDNELLEVAAAKVLDKFIGKNNVGSICSIKIKVVGNSIKFALLSIHPKLPCWIGNLIIKHKMLLDIIKAAVGIQFWPAFVFLYTESADPTVCCQILDINAVLLDPAYDILIVL